MSNNWKSKNRHKYLLQYHLVFVCKYRKKLLASKLISDNIKQLSYDICQKHNVKIHKMETDKDHIHYMIETEPNISLLIIPVIQSHLIGLYYIYFLYTVNTHLWCEYR